MQQIKTLQKELTKEINLAKKLSNEKTDKREKKKRLDKINLLRDCIKILQSANNDKLHYEAFLNSEYEKTEKKLSKIYSEINELIKDKPYLKKSTAFIQLNKTFDLKTLEYQNLILKTILQK